MTRLKLSDLADEKPVRLTIEVSARLHRELLAYQRQLAMDWSCHAVGGDQSRAPKQYYAHISPTLPLGGTKGTVTLSSSRKRYGHIASDDGLPARWTASIARGVPVRHRRGERRTGDTG